MGQGGMNAKNVDLTQLCDTNDAFYTLNAQMSIFTVLHILLYKWCILHLEIDF